VFHSAFERKCRPLYISNGDDALVAKNYDKSNELYSASIELDFANEAINAERCTAKLGKMLWHNVFLDAQEVRQHLFVFVTQAQPFVLS
jgi:hypothetical protein